MRVGLTNFEAISANAWSSMLFSFNFGGQPEAGGKPEAACAAAAAIAMGGVASGRAQRRAEQVLVRTRSAQEFSDHQPCGRIQTHANNGLSVAANNWGI
jgi:hypothetical protein